MPLSPCTCPSCRPPDSEEVTEYPTCDQCGTPEGAYGPNCNCYDYCDTCDQREYRCRCCGYCERYPCRCNVCEDCDCDPCECRDEGLESYGFKPTPLFHGDGPLFMGLELEVEMGGRSSRGDAVTAVHDALGDLVYCKEDSSLNTGFEIVTHPMSWPHALTVPWGTMLDDIRNLGAIEHDNAGLHVHVNRTAFDGPCHVYRWMKLFYRNERQVARVARRRSEQWAPFRSNARAAIKELAKGRSAYSQGLDRYQAINTAGASTFELRIFASTLSLPTLTGTLGFVASTVDYTRSLTTQDIAQRDGWLWMSYVDFLRQRSDTYAPTLNLLESTCAC